MRNVFELEANVYLLIAIVLLVIKVFALVNALMYSSEAYRAANKLTKPAWVAILGVAVAVQIVIASGLINLVLTVAALVYLADVRPALAGLRRR